MRHSNGPAPVVDISVHHAVTITVQDSIELFRLTETSEGYERLGDLRPLDRKLRIGFAPQPADKNQRTSPETLAAVTDVANLCTQLGHDVIDFEIPLDGESYGNRFISLWAANAAAFAEEASEYSGKPIGPDILEAWTLGLYGLHESTKDDIPESIAYLQAFEDVYNEWFKDIDILLTPVVGSPAIPIGEQDPSGDFETVFANLKKFGGYTSYMNAAGSASMSVPLSWTPSGLPVGSLFSGKRGDDGLLFELALQLEAARPWLGRVPPVSAF